MLAEKLIDDETLYNGENTMSVQEISLNKIKLSKNSRMSISPGDLSDLMASIKEQGLLQPIGVMKNGVGYEVCYGNRRFLAMSKLGKSKISCVVHDRKSDSDVDIKNLTENLQRRNISLAEAGRYMSLLLAGKLTTNEIATRLGMSKNYVNSCLSAYEEVPTQFRNDLEVRTTGGKKPTAGKIPMKTAQHILSAQKSYGLSKDQVSQLFSAAKNDDNFMPDNVKKYAGAMISGKKNFIKAVKPMRHVAIRFWMNEDDCESLERRFVDDGPYRTIGGLMIDILQGKKALKINIQNRAD